MKLKFCRGVLDVPLGEAKEVHVQPTPRLGGLAIFPAFALAVMVAWVLPIERQDGSEAVRSVGLLAGAFAIFLLGVWDDLRELSPAPQFVALALASAMPIVAGVRLADVRFCRGRAGRGPGWAKMARKARCA